MSRLTCADCLRPLKAHRQSRSVRIKKGDCELTQSELDPPVCSRPGCGIRLHLHAEDHRFQP